MCVRRSSRSTAIRPVCGTRSSRCWCLYCFNVCWAGSAVFFTAKKISDETRNIDLTKYKRRRHEERTRPAAPHSLQHRSVSSVGSQPISHTPAHEPDVTWRCETGFNPSLSRPSSTRPSNALDLEPSCAVFFAFFDHTPNKNARPIHTQMRRASYDPRTPITSACMHVIAEIDVLCMQFGSVNSAEMRGNLRTGSGKGGSGALNGPLMHAAS